MKNSMENIENLEAKLFELQNDILIMQKSMNLAHADQNKDSNDDKQELKNNSLEIKQLEKQVGEMQVKLERQQLNDHKLMQEALLKKGKGSTDLERNSPKEVLEQLESRVLNMSLKAQSQLQHLKHLERTFKAENEQLQKMAETCRKVDFSTEIDCLQRKKQLENKHCKTLKHIEECESANEKMKNMLNKGQKKKACYINLLAELTREQIAMTQTAMMNKTDTEEPKECKDVNREKVEKDLAKLKNEISSLKDITCCADIRKIDSAFLEKKATHKDLTEIVQKTEKHLIELKEEKRSLSSKRDLMKEVDSVYPKSDLSLAKSRLHEQQIRLDTAKEEMDRVNSHTKKTKDVFQKLIVKMNPKVNKAEMNKKDVIQLSKQLENLVKYAFPPAEPKFAAKTKK